MKDLIKKLKEANRLDALDSLEALKKVAAELGITQEEVDEFLENFDGFPLDDDELDEIIGGNNITFLSINRTKLQKNRHLY